jgi:two-component system chemotaxis response regulator CheB
LRDELVPKIRQFFATRPTNAPLPPKPVMVTPGARIARRSTDFRALGIGVSTGGPQALSQLIPQLPASLRVPVLIVQHMPPMFTRLLAERLDSLGALPAVEAVDGMALRAGTVYIAPGDYHLRVRRSGTGLFAALDQGPQENSCRPAVDVLFRSLAETLGKDVLSVVLTGMGFDGLRGTKALKAVGGYSLVQDQASSVVWGMPGAVAEAGLADGVFPLSALGPEIVRLAGA